MIEKLKYLIGKLKPILPYLAVILFFLVISCIYFSPVLQGKVLNQQDNTHAIGMAQELNDFENKTGEKSQWTNSTFSGMPAYQIKGDASTNIFWYLNKISRLGLPYTTIAILFLYLLGFFLLMRSLGLNHWLSTAGAVAFGFGSYNFLIIIAGHITKAYAIALMAPVIAGILYTYKKNKWVGTLFTAIALGLEISYNHIQITYYLAFLVLFIVIERFINAFKTKTLPCFAKRTGLLAVALILSILPNLTNLWTTNEYGKLSTRGKSELKEDDNRLEAKLAMEQGVAPQKTESTSGLDYDYAFAWSYGKMETFTFLVPNLMGGGSKPISQNPEALKNLDPRIDPQISSLVVKQSQYWGQKPFTEGPVYVGAIVCFLFFLGLFYYQGKEKWWLLAGTIFSMMLAWGNNLEWFNMFMFNHFPLYNKFRTVEMALVIATVTIPMLGMLGLKEIIDNPYLVKQKTKYFLAAVGITGGLSFIFYIFPDMFFNFISDAELNSIIEQKAETPELAAAYDLFMQEMAVARRTLLKSDALRSAIFIMLASGSIWFFVTNKISAKYLIPGIILLILIDLWSIDKRYIDYDKFKPERQTRQFVQSNADKEILKDKDPFYRVFSVANPFNEVYTSYFHKSIGGYHGAKLQRYQDVIDNYLQFYRQMLISTYQRGMSPNDILSEMPVLNMLNTRYIVFHPDLEPTFNHHSMGNAWFVKNVLTVSGVREELEALSNTDLREIAVIHLDFADYLKDVIIGEDAGTIELTHYAPNKTIYKSRTDTPQIAVFSEIYYPAGWNVYINGKKSEIIRANYILRAVAVPKGENTIEFKFEPKSFRYGKIIAGISSILILIFAGGLIFRFKVFDKNNKCVNNC
ncbi:MAG: YfhO family protein [Marinilabiliaceae bacterium]|nr:YfhO family protein [Marinilabiliaceae bacterium]